MEKSNTFALDASVAGGLALALLLVIVLDKVVPAGKAADKAPSTPTVTTTTSEEPTRARELRLAVTPTHQDPKGKWDDMGKLLDTLGAGYRYKMFPLKDLYELDKLEQFDVLFLTCAPGGTEPAVTKNLNAFVANGGTLYASDWRYDCVALAFPEFQAKQLAVPGKYQHVDAQVMDAGLRDLVGPTVPLRFDLSKWKPAAFAGDRVKVLIEGEYERDKGGGFTKAPLLVKFSFGKGTVIFTSFHNEKQNSEVEQKLLKYLVFSAVTAKLDAQVTQTMVSGGFSPQKSNLLSASSDSPKVSHTYRNKKAGRLRFTLGFENRGAKLHLKVVGPDGKTYEQEGKATFNIDVPQAPIGDWRYTVTAVTVPYPDFPFTLTVGESD